jgi:hypothetical protein
MARRSSVTASYQPSPGETFQVRVEAADAYPDAIDEARTQAVRGVTELMVSAQANWPHEMSEESAED